MLEDDNGSFEMNSSAFTVTSAASTSALSIGGGGGNDNDNDNASLVSSPSVSSSRIGSANSYSYSYSTRSRSRSRSSSGSTRKMLTDLIARDPANRACADCHCLLIDFTKMFASFYYPLLENNNNNNNDDIDIGDTAGGSNDTLDFTMFHNQFAPPPPSATIHIRNHTNTNTNNNNNHNTLSKKKRRRLTNKPDPQESAQALKSIAHGVFICQPCSIAHRAVLHRSITLVKSITRDQWSRDEVNAIRDIQFQSQSQAVQVKRNSGSSDTSTASDTSSRDTIGGNARAKLILEHCLEESEVLRPGGDSNQETRELFVRAKYELLAFVLPNGPLSGNGNGGNGHGHGHGGNAGIAIGHAIAPTNSNVSNISINPEIELPNRLVDYFCIISSTGKLENGINPNHPLGHADLSSHRSPSEICFQTQVTECFPKQNAYGDGQFPRHLNTFVFPNGCRPRKGQTPTLFTFTLTNEAGVKIYGAALHIYDTHLDMRKISDCIEDSRYDGALPSWLTTFRKGKGKGKGKHHHHHEHESKSAALTGQDTDLFFLPKCLVVLSHYGFFHVWRKFLLQIYRISMVKAPLPLERYIANFVCEVPLPPVGRISVKVAFADDEAISISRPPVNRLPLVDCSYRPLFTCLSVSNVMVIMGCLLQETRVALCSKHVALLGPCCEALSSLLFPFVWQGIYIPILPTSMSVDFLEAPVPFLVGLHRTYLDQFPIEMRPNGVVFVDLDEDIVHLGYEEGMEAEWGRLPPFLPVKDAAKLKIQLEQFGGSEFIVPDSTRKGRITYGDASILPNEKRSTYCRTCYANCTLPRSKHLAESDLAFMENEHLMPIDFSVGTLTHTNDSNAREFKMKGMTKGRRAVSLQTVHKPKHLLDIESPNDSFDPTEIRNAFLRFVVSLFQGYEKFISQSDGEGPTFLKEKFIHGAEAMSFVSDIVDSQMFQRFIDDKVYSPETPSIKFFDDSIIAKKNRSRVNVGRRRETKFISDTRGAVVETFVPPDPSTQGIAEDSFFHYNKFPETLEHSLFGTIRKPKQWDSATMDRRKRSPTHMSSALKKSIVVKQQIMTDLLKPYSESQSAAYIEKDANWALHAITYQMPDEGDGGNNQYSLSPDLLEKARSIIANTRDKQIIHVINIMVFQKYWISHRIFNSQTNLEGSHDKVIRKNWWRSSVARTSWDTLKSCITLVQSRARGNRVRRVYIATILLIAKIQAVVRGHQTRKKVRDKLIHRFTQYYQQIVLLWERAQTSLFYRSRFMLLNNIPMFLESALLESELAGLYATLGIKYSVSCNDTDSMLFESPVYAASVTVQSRLDNASRNEQLFPAELNGRNDLGRRLRAASVDVLLERVSLAV